MPIATVDPNESVKIELVSAPADPNNPADEQGFVMLRPLPYGKKLERRDKATKMFMRTQAPEGSGRGKMAKSAAQDAVMEFETANEWAVLFDFGYCIVDHNLTDSNGVKLDFTKAMTFKSLDPRIGTEIEYAISGLNELEDEESMEDFLKRSSTSSTDVPTLDKASTDEQSQILDKLPNAS